VPHFRNISDAWNSSHRRVLSGRISQTAHSNDTLNPTAWKMQMTAWYILLFENLIRVGFSRKLFIQYDVNSNIPVSITRVTGSYYFAC